MRWSGHEGKMPGLHGSRVDGVVQNRDGYTEELSEMLVMVSGISSEESNRRPTLPKVANVPARSSGSTGVLSWLILGEPFQCGLVWSPDTARSDSLTDTVISSASRSGPKLHPDFVSREIKLDKLGL